MSERQGNWEEVTLGDVAEVINGRAYKLSEWETSGTPVIRLQNLTQRGGGFYFSNLALPEKQYCHKGDLLYMWSATFGPHIWWGEKAIFHYHIWKIEPNERIDKKFLFYLLDAKTQEWKAAGSGMAMIHLTKAGIEKEPLDIPPLPEQKKIAEILSGIDSQINLIVSQGEQAKKAGTALTKQLLSSFNGDFLPLSEVATNYDSQRVPIKSIDREGRSGPYRYFGASGVIDMIDDYLFDGEFILVGEDGANIIDRNKPLAFRVAGKFWVNNHAHVIQPKNMCDLSYLTHYLESLDYTGIASGSAQPKITRASLDSIQIPIPPIEDQRKIGAAIDSAFNLVKEIDRKKHKLLSMKSAISSDLLSGRKRVSV